MRTCFAVVLAGLVLSCAPDRPEPERGDRTASQRRSPRAASPRTAPPGPMCSEPDFPVDLALASGPAAPSDDGLAPRRPPRRPAPSPRLFALDPASSSPLPAPFLGGEASRRRGSTLETAFQLVRDVRRRGVARVELPAGNLGLYVSGDAAKVVLSGSF